MRNCFSFYENGEMIATLLTGFENKDESEIIEAAKNYALGETPDKEIRRNLKNVRNKKCKLLSVVEVISFNAPLLNLIYPEEIDQNVEMCLDILADKYLPMIQAGNLSKPDTTKERKDLKC